MQSAIQYGSGLKTAPAIILTACVILAALAGALRLGYLPNSSFTWWIMLQATFFVLVLAFWFLYHSRLQREVKVGILLGLQLLVFAVMLNYATFMQVLVTLVITVSATLWMYYRVVVEFRRRKYA